MAHLRPVVLQGSTVSVCLKSLLELERPVTIIICETKASFVQRLLAENATPGDGVESGNSETTNSDFPSWKLEPTLRILAASHRIKLVFTADISHFRAHVAIYNVKQRPITRVPLETGTRVLAVLNLIDLHRFTSSFSAQGVHRSLAALVETADFAGEQLIVCEVGMLGSTNAELDPDLPDDEHNGNDQKEDPWEAELSILNATNRSYSVGQHGWAGRTIRLRTIAERWFTFTSTL